MLELSETEESRLAQAVLKSGITPKMCEQNVLPKVKQMFDAKGFTHHQMKTIFDRWDMDGARKKFAASKKKKEKQDV